MDSKEGYTETSATGDGTRERVMSHPAVLKGPETEPNKEESNGEQKHSKSKTLDIVSE